MVCCEAGGCERGPGVPGERTSSFTGPPYESDEEGGRCNQKKHWWQIVSSKHFVCLAYVVNTYATGGTKSTYTQTKNMELEKEV